MRKNTFKILAIFLVLFANQLFAQNDIINKKFDNVTIEGKVTDPLIQNLPGASTEVWIEVSKYPFDESYMQAAPDFKRYITRVRLNENFKMTIRSPAKRFYMYISYEPDIKHELFWSKPDNVYMLDDGDRVKVNLTDHFFSFSGIGAAKLNCESEIYKQKYDCAEYIVNAENSGNYKYLFDTLSKKIDSCIRLQTTIIDRYRNELTADDAEILLANCYALGYFGPLSGIRQGMGMTSDTGIYNPLIVSSAYKRIDSHLESKINPNLLSQSPLYINFVMEKMRMDNFLIRDSILLLPLSIRKTYINIKEQYKGIIRDKLLALFFLIYSRIPTCLDYLDDALKLCDDNMYKECLSEIKTHTQDGAPFYPFELSDTKGKIVKLSDFKHKVVILDFWYTGCENCIFLHNAMRSVKEVYKNNRKVAFVSISIDKNKQEWLKSVQSKRYVDPEDVNLFTGGKEQDYPLIDRYKINGYPTTFILKDGNMFSSNPPYPNGKTIEEGGKKQLIQLIDRAIKQLTKE